MLTLIGQSLRYLWVAPCSLVGLALGSGALLAGGSVRRVEGTLEFSLARVRPSGAGGPARAGLASRLPFVAITLGHVIVGRSRADLQRWRRHERVHVRQYEAWGPLFFVAYPACSLIALMRRRDPYWHNHFEVQARARSE